MGLVLPNEFKLQNESVAFTVPVPVSCKEVEIPSTKEIKNFEESGDYEEKFRMVVKKDGKRDEAGIILLCQKDAKVLFFFQKKIGHSQIPEENGNTLPTQYEIWVND